MRGAEPRWTSAAVYRLLQDEFPEIQPIGNMAIQIIIGPVAPPPPSRPIGVPAPAFRFASAAGDRSIQLSDTNFIFIVSQHYPGWDSLSDSILKNWKKIQPVLTPKEVTKIGLRYINRIKKSEKNPLLADWIRPTKELPPTLIASKAHFLARLESSIDSDNLMLVTLANQNQSEDAPHGAIVFDIDRIRTKSMACDSDAIRESLESLHDDVWEVFWSARTDALEHALKSKE